MLSFFKKRRERKAQETAEAAKSAAAHRSGQDAGRAMFDAIFPVLDRRIEEVSARLLSVPKDRLGEVTGPAEGLSAADVCRVEVNIFIENVKEFPDKLMLESEATHKEWLDLARTIGVTDLIVPEMKLRLSNAATALTLNGAVLGGERIQELKARGIE